MYPVSIKHGRSSSNPRDFQRLPLALQKPMKKLTILNWKNRSAEKSIIYEQFKNISRWSAQKIINVPGHSATELLQNLRETDQRPTSSGINDNRHPICFCRKTHLLGMSGVSFSSSFDVVPSKKCDPCGLDARDAPKWQCLS